MPGSWQKRGKDSYKLHVCIGTDFRGKPNRYTKTVHCKSDKEADKELAKFYAACEAGDASRSDKITLDAFCDKWMEDYLKAKVKKASYAKYRSIINIWIKPVLGSKSLSKIKPVHILEWIKYLTEYEKVTKSGSIKKLSAKTIHDDYSLLNSIFNSAKKWEYIRSNPCENIDPPSLNKEEADFYNLEEVTLLLDKIMYLEDDGFLKNKVGIFLDLQTGLRGCELAGLSWEDIDLETAELSVNKIREYVHKFGVVEGPPKTKKSKRTISIPQSCVKMLKQLKLQQMNQKMLVGDKWQNTGYVFIDDFGAPLFPRYLSKWFTAFLKQEGLRRITLHKLRHTHVSILDYLGVKETEISGRVGHSNLSTTRNTYTHIFSTTDKDSSNKLEEFFNNVISK